MATYKPFDDEVLGHVTFDARHQGWTFHVTINGRQVPGKIIPENPRLPLEQQGLDEIRECVAWIRDNEPSIRQYITDEIFNGWLRDWYDEEIDTVNTPEGFRETISLSGFTFLEDRFADMYYGDGNLFGGHFIVLSVGAGGQYEQPPNIWG